MNTVTISPKFQIVIPKLIRESMGIYSGQKVQMLVYKDRIELIPIRAMRELKGFLTGIDSTVIREGDRL